MASLSTSDSSSGSWRDRVLRLRPLHWLGLGALVGVIGSLAWLYFGAEPASPPTANSSGLGLALGTAAPDFELNRLNGEQVRLSELRGQVVLLNFWATWCGPCEIEMPALQAKHDAFADQGLVVLAIDNDEPAELVAAFADRLGLTIPLLLDPGGEVQRLYRVRGYPTTYVIGRDGEILQAHIGLLTEGVLDEYLEAAGIRG